MSKVRIIGTYQPARTLLHAVDARAKIGFVLLMAVALLIAHSAISFAVCAVLLVAALILSKTNPMQLAPAVKPAGILLAIFMMLGLIVPPGGIDGLAHGMLSALRIWLIVGFALVLASTTTHTQLADAFSKMLSPFKTLGMPVGSVAQALSTVMLLIPLLMEENVRISAAQNARGASLRTQGVIAGFSAARMMVAQMFSRLRADARSTAASMERRGFDGTQFQLDDHGMRVADWLMLAIGLAAIVVAVIL